MDVYTLLKKDITNKQHEDILVMISFTKDESSNNANNFKVAIYNHFVGSIVPEIKNEIDELGDLVFKHLSNTLGADNVIISRKEWGPPRY